MSDRSSIAWTDASWNPVRGCTKVSPGCMHCYAETFAERWRGVPGHSYEYGFNLRLVPDTLSLPLRWRRPRLIFVNSMSDLFHGGVPDAYVGRTFEAMRLANWHIYQVLTKRADRMRTYVETFQPDAGGLRHVWLGVSVENRQHGLPRIEQLRATPAALRFLSIEPLIEDLGPLNLDGIGWVIVGGESGHGHRVMQPEWVRLIRDQCRARDVPFFFKQWSCRYVGEHEPLLDGEIVHEFPPMPTVEPPSRSEVQRRRQEFEGCRGEGGAAA